MLHYLQNLFQALDVSSLTDAVLELCKARVLHLAGSETDCIVRQERDDVPENLTF